MEELTEKGLGKAMQASFTVTRSIGIPEALSAAQTLSAMGVDRVMPRQVGTGSYRGEQRVGSNNLIIDSTGNRIMVSDDLNTRVVLGKVR
jgi:hypothetical protein